MLKLYALVFNLASCAVLFAACALYLQRDAAAVVGAHAARGRVHDLRRADPARTMAAFLTKKIEGELDRVDEVCAVPRQDTTDEPLAPRRVRPGDGRRVVRLRRTGASSTT